MYSFEITLKSIFQIEKHGKGDDEEKARKRREETEKILSQFRSLSSGQQEEQRKMWNEELKLVKDQRPN